MGLSAEWQDDWSDAIIACKENHLEEAEFLFGKAICEMEQKKDQTHPEIYVDRSRLYLLLERNLECISDIDMALSFDCLTGEELTRAIVTRWLARSKLGLVEDAINDLDYFASVNKENLPKKEVTKKYIIIRNIPECECYRNIMTCYYIHSGICDSKEDITMTESGICIIKRAKNCGCNDCEEKKALERNCDACGRRILKPQCANQDTMKGCKDMCDRMAVAGGVWCGAKFKTGRCQAACALAVNEIRNGCHWCCKDGGFYDNCIKPFADILAMMGNVCDPAWD